MCSVQNIWCSIYQLCMCQAMESGTFTNQLLVPRLYIHTRHWKSENRRMSVSNARMCTYISAILISRTGFTIVTPHTAGYDIQQLIPRILYFLQNIHIFFFFANRLWYLKLMSNNKYFWQCFACDVSQQHLLSIGGTSDSLKHNCLLLVLEVICTPEIIRVCVQHPVTSPNSQNMKNLYKIWEDVIDSNNWQK